VVRLNAVIAEPIIEDEWIEGELLRCDLAYFAEKMLAMEINGHHKSWSSLVARHKRLGINAPRDHGKSFMFSFAYVIWRAYYKWIPQDLEAGFKSIPRISLGYIFSATQDQAISLLELVKSEIESNPKLAHLLPDRKDTWSKTEIKLANGAIIRARGWGTRIRGAHPVWIICDDVLNDETIYSEVQRRKQIDYFFSAVTPMIVPGGQLIVVGTPFHHEDLYAKLEQNRVYKFSRFAALNDQMTSALWPTRYSLESLKQKKEEVGSTRFTREYLCLPISDDSSLFPEKIINDCMDHSYEMPTRLSKEDHEKLQVYTGVDLALSTTVGADYTVITTIGVDENKNKWILDIRRKKGMGMTDQLREIQDVYLAYKPQLIMIEDNAFQRVFKDELTNSTDMPVKGFTTTAHRKHDFSHGVPSLQILFENKKLVIGRKTERDRRLTDPLIGELKAFTFVDGKLQGLGAHDDTVLSLWIAIEASREQSFNFGFA
jgi:hypothetical protein